MSAMPSRWHARGYHEWARSTPVIDAVGSVLAVASIIVGSYALIFLMAAVRDGNGDVAMQNVSIVVVMALLNALLEGVRRWRRHHG